MEVPMAAPPMEVPTAARPPSGTGSSLAAYAYPRWVILEKHCKIKDDGSSWPTAVAKTVAAARTSFGRPIQVSLSLQDPPAASAVYVRLPHLKYSSTVATHGGSLLIEVMIEPAAVGYYEESSTTDYFVYNVGDAAADPPRPPSLLLLPQYYPSESEDDYRTCWGSWGWDLVNRGWLGLRTDCTGILRRARGEDDDEVVVAELQMVVSKNDYTMKTAELLVFSSGEWSLKRPRIWYGDDDDELGEELPSRWNTCCVFAVGDTTTLCWADTSNGGGLLFYDVLDDSPSPWLHYVPLPKALPSPCLFRNRTICTMAGGGGGGGTLIRLVNIFPRCCCGGAGASHCEQSHHAYTITTWALRMDDDGIAMDEEWVMDGMVDATELWSLDAYKGLPRVPLSFPVVSMYEPHVICFSLCESYHVNGVRDETVWLVIVDMRSKTIRSVSRLPDLFSGRDLIFSNVSNYLNPYQTSCSSGDDGTSMTGQIHTGQNEREHGDDMNSMLRSPCKSARTEPAAQASSDEILAAIREIPSYGLASNNMLKAYQILSGDNGSLVRSLLRLPKNLRKDRLLVEIKEDDAY